MSKNIVYVCHLPFNITEENLKAFFADFGTITEINIPPGCSTKCTRGFGFIEFSDDEAATKAVAAMDGAEITIGEETRQLSVKIADDRKKRRGRSGRW